MWYQKFVLDIKLSTGKPSHFVPTLDIDLSHQLHPVSYRDWCVQQLGRALNHDDTRTTETSDGLLSTSLAWLEPFGEGYTTEDLRSAYLTAGRKLAGVIFPPYGLHVLKTRKLLAQKQKGMHWLSLTTFIGWC